MSAIALERPRRRYAARVRTGTTRTAELLLVLAALWGLWEGFRGLWIHEGWAAADHDPLAPRALHRQGGARRVRRRRIDRVRARRRPCTRSHPPPRPASLRRRLADDPDHRDRTYRRRRLRQP